MRSVLSIAGGGIRGIIPALVLDYLERQSVRPISHLLNLAAGTTSGGIIALGLAETDAHHQQSRELSAYCFNQPFKK